MALIEHLQSLGATHLLTLNNVGTESTDDLGNSVSPTRITSGNYSFTENPVCEGFTHSLKTTTSDSVGTDGAVLVSQQDINAGDGDGDVQSTFHWSTGSRTVYMWIRVGETNVPTCVYEQGGTTNNFAFLLGIGKALTWQSAVSGEPFMIAQSNFQLISGREYFICGTFEQGSRTTEAGVIIGNNISLSVNGVLQERIHSTSVAPFPAHPGHVVVGNTAEGLQSYNGGTIALATLEKESQLLGFHNNRLLTVDEQRGIFERTVRPTVTIEADTVVNQQAALDALSGNSYSGDNCAIRILQATDETDYRLFVDNITFSQNEDRRDIAIQYVGPNVLTLENANGSNIVEVSTPPEVEFSTGVVVGGGSIVLIEGTTRITSLQAISDITDTKLVITEAGRYTIENVRVDSLENVSGGSVTISSENDIGTLIGDNIELNLRATLTLSGIEDSAVYLTNGDESFFESNFTGDYTRAISKTGTENTLWTWVVSRAGYDKVAGRFRAGSDFSQEITYSRKIDFGSGLPAYTGLASGNVSFSLVDGTIIAEFIGDMTAPYFFDGLEMFLETEDGCKWIARNRSAISLRIGTAFAGEILVVPGDLVFQSRTSGSKNLSAFVITEKNNIDRSLFGSVVFNKSETSDEISGAVWDYLESNPNVSGSMKEVLEKARSHALAANLQTQNAN